ncbi:hypothetical protein BD410DRAFT_805963 [Rickenella mellea]|uniref:Uncharacterized protein n=1 Tax=Rickenella mellea TaxID=50990 RepID=A0A4Y7PUU3_9AGAM|nr:hypothetical protein BD410DRAFT_805963 [Rickenella mellea]
MGDLRKSRDVKPDEQPLYTESNLNRTGEIPRGGRNAPSVEWLQRHDLNRNRSEDKPLTKKAAELKQGERMGMPRGGQQVTSAERLKTGDATPKVARNGAAPESTIPDSTPASSPRHAAVPCPGTGVTKVPYGSARTSTSTGYLPNPWPKDGDEKKRASSGLSTVAPCGPAKDSEWGRRIESIGENDRTALDLYFATGGKFLEETDYATKPRWKSRLQSVRELELVSLCHVNGLNIRTGSVALEQTRRGCGVNGLDCVSRLRNHERPEPSDVVCSSACGHMSRNWSFPVMKFGCCVNGCSIASYHRKIMGQRGQVRLQVCIFAGALNPSDEFGTSKKRAERSKSLFVED